MIEINQGPGKQIYRIGFDSQDTVNVVPDAMSFCLEWTKLHLVAYAEYRGWTVVELDEDKP